MRIHISAVAAVAVLFVGSAVLLAEDAGENKPKRGKVNKEEIKAKIEANKEKREEMKEKREEAKEKNKEKREALQDKAENRIDKRQDNQAKRIEHGISKGYLTEDEVKKLTTQQQAIANLETTIKSDSKITGAEWKSIRDALNDASRNIWAEKHDTDGKQMAVYRLGKNVFAKSDLTAKLAADDISAAEAKALMKDFRSLVELKQKLAGDLSDADRAALQAQYNELLNKYFETR